MGHIDAGRPFSLLSIVERARQAPLGAFEDLVGAQYLLVGAEDHARGADPLQTAVAYPVRTRRPGFSLIVVVGRAASSDVCIDSRSVSKVHARIRLLPGGLALSDAGSRNGTTLNAAPVTSEVALSPRDVVVFGYRSFTLVHVSSFHRTQGRVSLPTESHAP